MGSDTCCGEDCLLIEAEMALITDGNETNAELCAVLRSMESFSNTADTIPGVQQAYWISSDQADIVCPNDVVDPGRNNDNFSPLNQQTFEDDESNKFDKIFWPLFGVIVLLLCCCCCI